MREVGYEKVSSLYDRGVRFNSGIDLYETVENSERFFIGDQWHGVETNGNPAPVYNFLKRVVLFQVAKVCSESFAMQVEPLAVTQDYDTAEAALKNHGLMVVDQDHISNL